MESYWWRGKTGWGKGIMTIASIWFIMSLAVHFDEQKKPVISEQENISSHCSTSMQTYLSADVYVHWVEATLTLGILDTACFKGLENLMNEITDKEDLISAHQILRLYKSVLKEGEGVCIHAKALCELGSCGYHELYNNPEKRKDLSHKESFYQEECFIQHEIKPRQPPHMRPPIYGLTRSIHLKKATPGRGEPKP